MPKPIIENSSKKTIHDTPLNISPMKADTNYLHGQLAKEALMRGVFAVRDAVAPTIGPAGHDAIVQMFEWPYSGATNDGAFIAERVKSHDPFEQMGVRLIQEAIGRANKASGDGSTTTCILTAAILEEGQKHEGNLKAELNACLPLILESLDKQTKEVSMDDVWKVATTSAQDEEMGRMIGDIFKEIGKDGVVDWDTSNKEETTYSIKEGIELKNVTFAHESLINAHTIRDRIDNPREGNCIVVLHPQILITKQKIQVLSQLNPYADSLKRNGVNEMVVFCDDIEPMVKSEIELISLGINPRTMQPIEPFKIILLQAPTLWKDWLYEDFALMTGATVFGDGGAAQFKGGASLSWLGTCDKLVAKRDGTYVIGGKDISEHITILKEASKEQREFEKRVEWLNSKGATVKMGARSEVELFYKRMKFDDSRSAAKLALQSGIVTGGGTALAKCVSILPDTTGAKILKKALLAPMNQIYENAGMPIVVEQSVALDSKYGIDVKQRHSVEDMFEAGITDPADVVKNAVKAAISVAGTVLDCDTLIPLEKPEHTPNRYA